jgi:hypothetical protein
MIYKLHVFSFNGFETFLYFVKGVIPERLNIIRSLEIQGVILPSPYSTDISPNDFKTWKQTWSTIANMENLSKLAVIIEPGDLPLYSAEEEAAIFAPLKQIRHVADYEVQLNWERQRGDREPECGPYRITRPLPLIRSL